MTLGFRSRLFAFSLGALAIQAFADGCIYDWSHGASSSAGGASTSSQSSAALVSTGSTAPSTAVSSTSSQADTVGSSSSGTTATVSSSSSSGGPCNGMTCKQGEFCFYKDGLCGKQSAGVCTTVTQAQCPDGNHPAGPFCGCDGKEYKYYCDAQNNQVDLGPAANCVGSYPGTFACGDALCMVGTTYCQSMGSVQEPDGAWACLPFTQCGSPKCICLNIPAQCSCAETGMSLPDGVFVKCP